MEHGSENISGLGRNKQAYIAAGADLDFLASAMMETKAMDPASYPRGDQLKGVPKVKDDFNVGACKQNWGMMRPVYFPWKKLGPNDYLTAVALNYDKNLDVLIYKLCLRSYGQTRFLAGHRNGSTGLDSPNTPDINNFIRAWRWTRSLLDSDSNNLTNDVRFFVVLPPI